MKFRTRLLFVLLALLPIALLSVLAQQAWQHAQQGYKQQAQELAEARLQAVAQPIDSYFAQLRQALLQQAQLPLEQLLDARFAQQQPLIRQVFLLDAQGNPLYPAEDAPTGKQFWARMPPLNEQKVDFWSQTERQVSQGKKHSRSGIFEQRSVLASAADEETQPLRWGWHRWFQHQGEQHIFWLQLADERILGFELERVRLLADVLNLLPEHIAETVSAQLLDARAAVFYQWGETLGSNVPTLAMLPLSAPLDSWMLKQPIMPDDLRPQGQGWLIILLSLSAAGIVLGLSVYLYREHSRELRLAAQRMNFVNQVSHELRTPLTNIRLYAELLADHVDEDDAQAQQQLQVIDMESQRLSRLIGNVLNFARVQRGTLQLQTREAVVDEVIQSCIAASRPALESAGLQLELALNAQNRVLLDSDALEQILHNLLNNAEKYAADGGFLAIRSTQLGNTTQIRVQDHGKGIPKAEQAPIFQAFYRVDSRLNAGAAGTGIGLSIARQLAQLHQGDLWLSDEGDTQGACFVCELQTPALTKTGF